MSRLFVLVFVGLFIAAGGLELSEPIDSSWTTALIDGDDGDADNCPDEAVDAGPLERRVGVPSPSRSRLPTAPAVATRPSSVTPHDKRAPPVL